MQAAAAGVGRSRLPSSVLRGLALAAGLAARAATRVVEGFARCQALVYATGGEITLADLESEPDIERVVTAVFGSMVVTAGAFFVAKSIADVVAERSRTRKQKRRCCHPYALMGRWYDTSSSHEEVPAPGTAPPRRRRAIERYPLPPRRAVAPFDASRAIVAWLQECEAAGIKHRMHQRK